MVENPGGYAPLHERLARFSLMMGGDIWKDPRDGAEYVRLPGTVKSASTQSLWVMKAPVPYAAFQAFRTDGCGGLKTALPTQAEPSEPELAPARVSLEEAVAYCAFRGGRLPSEQDWKEVVDRIGDTSCPKVGEFLQAVEVTKAWEWCYRRREGGEADRIRVWKGEKGAGADRMARPKIFHCPEATAAVFQGGEFRVLLSHDAMSPGVPEFGI